MKANENYLFQFLDGSYKKFVVPEYQSAYMWNKERCKQLLDDLMNVYERDLDTYFFGTIVYNVRQNENINEYIIVDGQQRMTTISLLLLAICNYIVENDKHSCAINPMRIKSSYLIDEFATDNQTKLILNSKDYESYNELIQCGRCTESNRLSDNYLYLYECISKMTDQQIEAIYNSIRKFIVVCIQLDANDDPQMILERLNTTGANLHTIDQLKNHMLKELPNFELRTKFYADWLEPLENNITYEKMDDFIKCYLMLKQRNACLSHRLDEEFISYVKKEHKEIKDVLEEMLVYSNYFKQLEEPIKDTYFNQFLDRIKIFDYKMVRPLLMDLLKAEDNGLMHEQEMDACLTIIENYLVRRKICYYSISNLSKVLVRMGLDVENYMEAYDVNYLDAFKHVVLLLDGETRFPDDEQFAKRFVEYEFFDSNSEFVEYILERIENYEDQEYVPVHEKLANDELMIERIMPDKLTDEWSKRLGANSLSIHRTYVNTIGNITLSSYNSDYSYKDFDVKKYLPIKGLKESDLSLNRYVKECGTWTELEIRNRTKLLSEIALKVWCKPDYEVITKPVPEVVIKPSDVHDDGIYSWKDQFDMQGKKLCKVEVFHKKIPVSTTTKGIRKIHEEIFDRYPQVYTEENFEWFSLDRHEFKKFVVLKSKRYINDMVDDNFRMNTVRDVANKLKLKPEDILVKCVDVDVKLEFDVNDEDTYYYDTVGTLAYKLFKDLFRNDCFEEYEINQLKTYEYGAGIFKKMWFPIISDELYAHTGNSDRKRYRIDPIKYHGHDYFITTEWYEDDREALIKWYKNHRY